MNPEEERENPVIEKEITVSETLHKTVTILTQNYILKDMYKGEEGWVEIDADFTDTNLVEEYKKDNYTIEELLKEIPEFLSEIFYTLNPVKQTKAKILAQACLGWLQDEIEAVL